MAISRVTTTATSVTTTATSITPPTPSGVTANDLIIIQVEISKATLPNWSAASYTGWTLLHDETGVNSQKIRLLYRIADGTSTDNPPAFAYDATSGGTAVLGVYRGVDTSTPFIAEADQIETVSGTSHNGPTLTNTDANAWYVQAATARQVASPLTFTPGTGLTELQDVEAGTANTNNAASCWDDSNGTVATGSQTFTVNTSAATSRVCVWGAFLKPAAAGGTTQNGSVDSTASATVGIAPSVTHNGATDATASATAAVGPSVSHPGAAAATASATASIGPSVDHPGTVAATASATAAVGPSVSHPGTVAATASATASVGPSVSHPGSVDSTGVATAAVGPLVTHSYAVAATASATAAISAGATTWNGTLASTAAASATIAGIQTFIRALSASASASAAIGVLVTHPYALNPTATATAASGGTLTHPGSLAATAAATLGISPVQPKIQACAITGTPIKTLLTGVPVTGRLSGTLTYQYT